MKKLTFILLLLTITTQFGCAAVQHRNLETSIQMQQTIFVDPDRVGNKPIYVRVTNQTGKPELNFDSMVSQKLVARGYKVTKNSKEAGVRILVNFLYLDKAKEGMSKEGAVAGGVGGAVIGGAASNTYGGAALGGLAGAGLGALAGSIVSVDSWYGIIDVQVEEPLQKAATRQTTSRSGQTYKTVSESSNRNSRGSVASVGVQGTQELNTTDYSETVNHKKNQTRVVAEAKQTNINADEATRAIKEQLADSIANFL